MNLANSMFSADKLNVEIGGFLPESMMEKNIHNIGCVISSIYFSKGE